MSNGILGETENILLEMVNNNFHFISSKVSVTPAALRSMTSIGEPNLTLYTLVGIPGDGYICVSFR